MKRNLLILFCLFLETVYGFALMNNELIGVRSTTKGYLFEIPKSLLGRDFLLGARIQSISSTQNKAKLSAGQRLYDPVWVKFRYEDKHLLLLKPDPKKRTTEETHISYPAYERNTRIPVWQVFPVEEEKDSTIVVNLTRFFLEPIVGVDPFSAKMQPGKSITALNKILDINSRRNSLEITVQYGFEGVSAPFLTTVRKSLFLLPEQPMPPRQHDARVGYDFIQTKCFDLDTPAVTSINYLTRFRVVPEEGQEEAYLRGEKVKPAHPILFYVDDAFPALWKQAIKAGIADWNRAFEAIGFEGVMLARTYSEAADDFDPDGSQYNCFRYVVSDFPNAMGKHWVDPRSGEIIQADVLFYSNVIALLRKWYFLQTAAYNEQARSKTLPDSVLFRMVRYAAAHEIGHCLGLEHNFRASYAYPTEKLRDPSFTQTYGTTASIMDYARFNYIAQPGDNVTQVFPPYLGAYDYFAIKIGYTFMPTEDPRLLRRWVDEKADEPSFQFGRINPSVIPTDPSVQSTDLGNDLVASSTYGINNLRTILAHIHSWNPDSDNPFEGMPATYDELRDCYFDYVRHVIPLIGGVYAYEGYQRKDVKKTFFVERKESERAVAFVLRELTEGFRFLCTADVQDYAENQTAQVVKQQNDLLDKMLSPVVLEHIASAQQETGFSYSDYFRQLTRTLFSYKDPDLFQRNLQKTYVNKLNELINDAAPNYYHVLLFPVVEDQLQQIKGYMDHDATSWMNYLKTKIK